MDDVLSVILVAIMAFVLGIVAGLGHGVDTVNDDCTEYGKYSTSEYKLVCEKK